MSVNAPRQSGAQDYQAVEDGFRLNVVGGRDMHVEEQTFVSCTAIALVRKTAGNGTKRVIGAGGQSGILVTFATDADTEPGTQPRRGLVQQVFIPDNLELPAPPSKTQPETTGPAATQPKVME